jgi:hypothetical protein
MIGGSSGAPNTTVHLEYARILFKSNLTFTTTGSSGARLGEVQVHQMRQFTSNILEFLFKSNLISTTTGSLGARLGEVQAHQTRQFNSNMLEFLFKLDLILPIREVQEREWGSSSARNVAVQPEHTTIFI